MAGADVRKQALAEIAREKARMREEKALPSIEDALDFEEQERIKEELNKKDVGQKEGERIPFQQVEEPLTDRVENKDDGFAFNWVTYGGGSTKTKKKKKPPKMLNTATIWCMGRKMMAREWAKAKGITKRDPRVLALEREAKEWGERKEEEERKKEEDRLRALEQRRKIEEPLRILGDRLLAEKEEKGQLTKKIVNDLLDETLGDVSRIYEINWLKDGCEIWVEPWEEKRMREKMQETEPVIYKLVVDDNLEIVSYDLVTDQELKKKKIREFFGKDLQEIETKASLASVEEGLVVEDEEEAKKFLEEKLSKIGRIEEFKKWTHMGWTALIEPWDEMKKRNLERKGDPPIVTDRILARVVKGKLLVVPLKDAHKPWEKGYGVQEYDLSEAETYGAKRS
ncbi:MAG: hypothetical protein SCARUB_00552 [Candidatus Scalindua rubra]|uniref:Uncharacterized protein n=1 Tax=Candidatus Scalindua rubra TaxID=1872076 RepID=A0A1E3XF85_9BACT|nr:MAG: hypothetical protein SCARUB_00552 [Candidatus Scalindua rubra]